METEPIQLTPTPATLTPQKDFRKIFIVVFMAITVIALIAFAIVLGLGQNQASSPELSMKPTAKNVILTAAPSSTKSKLTPMSETNKNQNLTIILFPGSQLKGEVNIPSSSDKQSGYVVSAETKDILQYYSSELEKRGFATTWKQTEQVWQIYPDQFPDGIGFSGKGNGVILSIFVSTKKNDQGQTVYEIISPPSVIFQP